MEALQLEPQLKIEGVSESRINVLLLHIVYPMSISKYFKRALLRRPDVKLIDCGPYTGHFIPWMYGMELPMRYAEAPSLPLPFSPNVETVPYEVVRANLPDDFRPDLTLCVDAGINWQTKQNEGVVVTVATDPHVLNYDHARRVSDVLYNMQRVYSKPGDQYLPYAFDPAVHYEIAGARKDTDAALIGLPYEKRQKWVARLRELGISVIFENGPVFDEYRELNNRCRVGLNWSSMDDLNARVFEIMAMGLCPVINRVSDLSERFDEGKHYLGFSDLDEAVSQVQWALGNPEEARRMGQRARQHVWETNQTYDARVQSILAESGLCLA